MLILRKKQTKILINQSLHKSKLDVGPQTCLPLITSRQVKQTQEGCEITEVLVMRGDCF